MRRVRLPVASTTVGFLLVACLAAPLAAQCTLPPSGLVSWWSAEGDAIDRSGGNNGTLTGATTFSTGMVGQGFKLGGAFTDAVNVGAAANLQLQDFTIEGWVSRASTLKASLSGDGAVIFGFGSNGYGFGMLDDGRLLLTKIDVDGVTSTTLKVTDLNFHHVAVTKSGTTVIFYVDGVAETAPAYDKVYSFTTNASVGARVDNSTSGFLGVIDEPAVYNRDLTVDEIQAILVAGSAGKCVP